MFALSCEKAYFLHAYMFGCVDLMEGRVDNLAALHFGCSIEYLGQELCHFVVGIGVVCVCVGFVVPQTDRSDVVSAGIGECNFVLKPVLFPE